VTHVKNKTKACASKKYGAATCNTVTKGSTCDKLYSTATANAASTVKHRFCRLIFLKTGPDGWIRDGGMKGVETGVGLKEFHIFV
jgi:hypothetical protein